MRREPRTLFAHTCYLANRARDHTVESQSDFDRTATISEAEAVATLHRLNALYIRALVESDAGWYSKHLSSDFVCTLTDGLRINKTEFLRRIEQKPGLAEVTYDEIDVRPLGEVALVQGVMHCRREGASARFTHVWRSRNGRWEAVAAHATRVAGA